MKAFKWGIILLLLLSTFVGNGQTLLYSEDFNSYNNGTTSGFGNPPKWTIEPYQYANDLSSNWYFAIENQRMKIQNLGSSEISAIRYIRLQDIDISGYDNVTVRVKLPPSQGEMETSDQYYFKISTNGGASDFLSSGSNGSIEEETTMSVSGISGTILQVRIAFSNSGADEIYYADDIEVIGYNNYPLMWYRPERLTAQSDGDVSWWPDEVLGSGMNTTYNSTNGPKRIDNTYNFNPTIRFSGDDKATRNITNNLIHETDNTCFLVQKYVSGAVVMSMSQYNYDVPYRRFAFEGLNNNARFDFPNYTEDDGRLVGTTNIANQFGIFTLQSNENQNKIYIDGVLEASQNRTSDMVPGIGNYSFAFGTNNQFPAELYSTCDISEFLFFNEELTGNTYDSWLSYLGIKYGTTIGNNGSSFVYRNSQENIVWNGNTTYQNDVAGIATDDHWKLKQKVSSSINTTASTSANITMSTTNDFTSSNRDLSRTALGDGKFLIWGHNNGTYGNWQTSTDYKYVNRFWKVQNTNNVGQIFVQANLTNFPASSNGYVLIVDTDTNPGNGISSAYPLSLGSNNKYSGSVTFPAGSSYFTIGESLLPPTAFWVKADAGVSLESSPAGSIEIDSWADQSGTNNATSDGTWNKPNLIQNAANFNPSTKYFGTNDRMTINRPVQNDFTFALVVKPLENGPSGSKWWEGDGIFDGEVAGSNSDFGGLSILNNKLAFGTTGDDHTVVSSNPIYADNKAHIAIATRVSSSGLKSLYIDGITDNTGTGITGAINNPPNFRIGSLYSNSNYYNGHIFEIMTFPSVISNAERERIQTYFALKYGLSLSHNYTSVAGTIYWVSNHSHDIAGIGKDNTYGLDQKIATSSNLSTSSAGSTLLATTNDFSSSNQNVYRTALNPGTFLVWGHNNQAMTSWTTSGDYKHVSRRWKVRETGTVGSVHLQINLNNFPTPSGNYFILVDNDIDISNGVSSTHQLSNTSGDHYTTEIDFPSGTSYFTVGYSTEAHISFWIRADRQTNTGIDNQAISLWYDQSEGSNNVSQNTSANQPRFQSNEVNFNPSVSFDGSNDFFTFSSTSSLGYGSTERTSFIVAKDDAADQSSRAIWSYGQTANGKAWAFKRKGTSTREMLFVTWGNSVSGPAWGSKYRLLTGAYDSGQMKLYNEGGNLQSNTVSINTSESVANIGRHANNSEYWDGNIAEIIHYVGDMSESVRSDIESYLSIKYGITKQGNYTAASNTLYTISGYANHIAGIGKDTSYDLDQRISSSIESNSGTSSNVTISMDNNFTANNLTATRESLSNGQYLIWGHNNGNTNSWTTSGDYKHVDRKWKIENTGNVDSVFLQINLSGYPTPPVAHYLIVDNDNNISNGVSSIYLLSGSGNNYSCKTIFGNGTNYFTIGYYNADIDYGDAPNSYSTLIANSGPSHIIVSGTYLGSGVSNDTNGFRDGTEDNSDASDDTNDDGVSFNPSLGISSTQIIQAGGNNTVRINASAAGYISAWVDFNIDGDFDDSGEQIANNIAVNSGDNDITFNLANTNKHGKTYARFRFYTTSGEGSSNSGVANSGEVEDYQVHIASLRPSDICSNLIVNGGFEEPYTASYYTYTNNFVEGWNSSKNKVEIWLSNYVNNVTSQEGSQLAELNTNGSTTYYQDVITVPGETMSWQIYHRGRSGTDQTKLKLGPPGSTSDIQTFSTGTTWTQYTGSYTVPSGQHVTRFAIVTVSPTGGSGNLLDNIRFSVTDNTNPVITANEQNVVANNAGCTYLVSGTSLDAIASDNCSVSSLTHNYDGGGSSLDGKSFPIDTTDVTWTATDPDGNSSTQVMQVIVTTDLTISLAGPADNSVCSGVDAVFTATASGGLTNYTYSFYVNDTQVTTGVSNNTYTSSGLADGDIVKAKVTDSNSCEVYSSEITIIIHPIPTPVLYHE